MLTATLMLFTLAAPDPAGKDTPASKLDLFASEGWYKEQAGKEQEFVGVVMRADKKGGGIGFGRFNPYTLQMEKDVREIYVGGKPDILAPYVGCKVKLIGKPVDLGVEGRKHREIWPARLELISTDSPDKDVKDAKIFPIPARAVWPYGSTDPDKREKASQFVLRSAGDLVTRTPFNNLDAPAPVVEKMATEHLAKLLGVKAIDWRTDMLVVVTGGTQATGGFRVGVTGITQDGDKLLVKWFFQAPKGIVTDAFTHPAEVVVTNRFDGKIDFQMVDAPPELPDIKDKPPIKKVPKVKVGPPVKIGPIKLIPKAKLKLVPPAKQAIPPMEDKAPEKARPIEEAALEAAAGEKKADDKKPDDKKLDLKVHAESKFGVRGGHQVIRSAEELAKVRGVKDAEKASADLAKQLKVDAIDWKKQMVLLIAGGTQRSGGFSVELTGLTVKDKELTVRWKLNSPTPGTPVTLALTNPSLTLLVERFEGEVRFDPAVAKSKFDLER